MTSLNEERLKTKKRRRKIKIRVGKKERRLT
jgi:hypothetical protein